MMRREVLLRCVRAGVSGVGFKILLDLFATSPTPLRFREAALHTSAADIPARASSTPMSRGNTSSCCSTGTSAAPCRSASSPSRWWAASGWWCTCWCWACCTGVGSVDFVMAQSVATLAAMTGNFVLNNLFTYRDMRLRGWGLLRGWLSFVVACGLGALANVGHCGATCSNTAPAGWPRPSPACWSGQCGTTPSPPSTPGRSRAPRRARRSLRLPPRPARPDHSRGNAAQIPRGCKAVPPTRTCVQTPKNFRRADGYSRRFAVVRSGILNLRCRPTS